MAGSLFRDEEGGLPQTIRWDSWVSEISLFICNFPDAKKSVWVPDGEGGFDEALIDTVDGDKVNVKVGWEPKTFKSSQVMQVNPPKMEKFDDVSNMTYLNEAAVLWNLKARYVSKLIYTYSGKKLTLSC